MPAPATVDEFVDLVRKSSVLEEARLSAYVQKLKASPTPPRDLSALAGLFVQDGLLTFFQAEQFLQGKWKRFTVGKYKVLEKLGSGGMGQVFLCEHKLMRRRVAVKILPTQKANDPSSLERFYREARAVAALDHPNIVRAYDIDQDDNLHFLVMEYVDGANLQDMVRRAGPMDPTRACHYMYWSAVGLQHAHQQGLIHRDIKPGNILVDRQGAVKILDLGLARFFHDDEDLLTKKYDESVLGTADYLAPEQAVDSHLVDGRADIYSLGATFYFLLTGQPPFADGTVAQKLLWHQNKAPRPVRELRPEVPEAVAAVAAKMMAKRPEDRYQSPAELADALLPFTQTPIPPPPPEEMPQLSPAAQGGGSGPVAILAPQRPAAQAPRTPPPAPATKPSSAVNRPPASGSKPPKPAASPAPGVAVADADTRRNPPVPVVEPLPEPPPSTPIWEAIGAETADARRADTDRKKRDASSRRIKPAPKSGTKVAGKSGRHPKARRPALPLVLALVGGGVLLAAAAAAVYWFGFRSKNPATSPAPPPGGRTLVLTRSPTGPLQYASLQRAVTEFRPGDTIVIQDDQWEESVSVSKVKGLVIKPANSKRVTWRAPANKNAHFLLSLASAEGAQISGIRFEANPEVECAVRLGGPCPGLVLEDCELLNAGQAQLILHDCGGGKARPVTVRKCRIAGPNAKAGVQFTADPSPKRGFPAPGSQGVVVEDCLVEAPADGAGFLFAGSAMADVRRCRVWQGRTGAHFRKELERPDDLLWRVALTNTTFHSQTVAGVWIEEAAQASARPENRITLASNFFVETAPAVALKVDGTPTGPNFLAVEPNNARKAGTPPVAPPTFPVTPIPEVDADVNTDPANPDRLLTYDAKSPLMKAAGGKPAGAPPE